ncbi:MAG: polyprenyl synthetase family protein, partial [Spirochaetaceae bacterium]|nr:polyprenyl synthetase family protein [Spirochaetaceae bacterium]
MEKEFSKKLKKIEIILEKALVEDVPEAMFPSLVEPCRDLIRRGGKRWRPLLLVLCAELAAAKKSAGAAAGIQLAYQLTPLVEFIHNASLIHDDIEDSSDTRRGSPAVHIIYGVDAALNAASWLYFQAAQCITHVRDPSMRRELFEVYQDGVKKLHLGQALDIAWHRDNTQFPSVDEYWAMSKLKTGILTALAVQTGLLTGGASKRQIKQAASLAADAGGAFQLLDDVVNLTSGNPGKKRGDDIVEGKKSFPVLMHLEAHPEDREHIAECFRRAKQEGVESDAV